MICSRDLLLCFGYITCSHDMLSDINLDKADILCAVCNLWVTIGYIVLVKCIVKGTLMIVNKLQCFLVSKEQSL